MGDEDRIVYVYIPTPGQGTFVQTPHSQGRLESCGTQRVSVAILAQKQPAAALLKANTSLLEGKKTFGALRQRNFEYF